MEAITGPYHLIGVLVSVIKTHDSESRGQEEAQQLMRPLSELFTCSTTLKFANALAAIRAIA